MSLIQKLFDKTVIHLLTQMEQSISDDGDSCAYRGTNGLKCAIGALIDDKWYDAERLEDLSIRSQYVQVVVAKSQGFNLVAFYRDWETDRKSTRLNSSHSAKSRMPSSA